jgi:hypothetical protein
MSYINIWDNQKEVELGLKGKQYQNPQKEIIEVEEE